MARRSPTSSTSTRWRSSGPDPIRAGGLGLPRLGGNRVPQAQAEEIRSAALPVGLLRHGGDQLHLLPARRYERGAGLGGACEGERTVSVHREVVEAVHARARGSFLA